MKLPVETQELTKRYGKHGRVLAVGGLNLAVRPGEVYGFLGPNGAGKTTTLRMLLGLVRPTSGQVRLFGAPPGDLAEVGALIESPGFYPYLSGRGNLLALARYSGAGASRVDTVLDMVGLTARGGDRYATYSLGMKQRLGVAAALLKSPRLLILDEPTNGLDPAGMADMRVLIRELGADGVTVLLSSHLLGEVQQICDRVGVVSNGRLVAENTVAELRGTSVLRVAGDPAPLAAELARNWFGADRVRLDGDVLELSVEPDRAAWVNRELVTAGVDVRELRIQERDLEQVFFELTGQEKAHVG